MKISLLTMKAESLTFLTDDVDVQKDSFKLSFENGYVPEPDSKTFIVRFKISISAKEQYTISTVYTAEFETDSPITDSFKDSPFPRVNAPAIAYPFLRSFIAGFVLNAGYEPLIIPTLNFQAMNSKEITDPQ